MFKQILGIFLVFGMAGILSAAPTSVTLKKPAGGEKFRTGTSQDLTWDTTGTYMALWTFQFATSPSGPWTTLPSASKKLDSGATRGIFAGGFRVPAKATTTGYVRMVLTNSDGSLDESVTDMNDTPFEIEVPQVSKPDSVLRDAITGPVYLDNKKTYGLDGYLYVDNGGILNIPAGAVIIGDTVGQNSAICINRGGKIYAKGTASEPIVFTSSAAIGQRRGGDWGGILICGKATTNHPGGEAALEGGIADVEKIRGWFGGKDAPDDNDNSGEISYARVEFAGIAANPNQELNSITMGGVGRGTVLHHIQVSYANDDAFEWFGGTVNAKYLMAIGTLDDDFDGDNGWSGRVQFALTQRFRDRADVSTSQSFEMDNNSSGSFATPFTRPIFSNVTAIGAVQDTSWATSATGSAANTFHSKFGAAAQIRRNARTSIFNSVFVGWPRGLELLSTQSQTAATLDSIMFKNNSYFGIKGEVLRIDGVPPVLTLGWLATAGFNNVVDAETPTHAMLTAPFVIGSTEFSAVPAGAANYLSNASFTNGNAIVNIGDSFFDKVAYRGAFSPVIAERWDLPWAEYDPINAENIPSTVEEGTPVAELGMDVYPNPAYDLVKVIYNISSGANVTVKIFNSAGSMMQSIAEGLTQNQGYYEFNLDLRNLTSGVYFVQLSTDKGVLTKTLNVVR